MELFDFNGGGEGGGARRSESESIYIKYLHYICLFLEFEAREGVSEERG